MKVAQNFILIFFNILWFQMYVLLWYIYNDLFFCCKVEVYFEFCFFLKALINYSVQKLNSFLFPINVKCMQKC